MADLIIPEHLIERILSCFAEGVALADADSVKTAGRPARIGGSDNLGLVLSAVTGQNRHHAGRLLAAYYLTLCRLVSPSPRLEEVLEDVWHSTSGLTRSEFDEVTDLARDYLRP